MNKEAAIYTLLGDDNFKYKQYTKRNGEPYYEFEQLIHNATNIDYKLSALDLADGVITEYDYIFNNMDIFDMYELLIFKKSMNYKPLNLPKR